MNHVESTSKKQNTFFHLITCKALNFFGSVVNKPLIFENDVLSAKTLQKQKVFGDRD